MRDRCQFLDLGGMKPLVRFLSTPNAPLQVRLMGRWWAAGGAQSCLTMTPPCQCGHVSCPPHRPALVALCKVSATQHEGATLRVVRVFTWARCSRAVVLGVAYEHAFVLAAEAGALPPLCELLSSDSAKVRGTGMRSCASIVAVDTATT